MSDGKKAWAEEIEAEEREKAEAQKKDDIKNITWLLEAMSPDEVRTLNQILLKREERKQAKYVLDSHETLMNKFFK